MTWCADLDGSGYRSFMAWIGTSGWSYDHWDGVLYEPGTPRAERFSMYTSEFATVELNASFYRWPADRTFAGWRRRLPSAYRFTVKAARGLTHGKRLYEPERWIEKIAGSWHELGDKRGMVLFQLPPTMQIDTARLSWFLGRLPEWMRSAVEFRHPSWDDPTVFALLERHAVAYTVMSGAHLPCLLRVTAPEVYLRWHGPGEHLYSGSYSDDDLRWWAERIREWEAVGHQVYGYFNNDGHGHAVQNARRLRELLR